MHGRPESSIPFGWRLWRIVWPQGHGQRGVGCGREPAAQDPAVEVGDDRRPHPVERQLHPLALEGPFDIAGFELRARLAGDDAEQRALARRIAWVAEQMRSDLDVGRNGGAAAGARLAGAPPEIWRWLGFGLVPQAGVAVGLALALAQHPVFDAVSEIVINVILGSTLLTAVLLVFVDVLKELPATLILRPFNYNTLAVRAYELASDERLADSSTAALAIVLFYLLYTSAGLVAAADLAVDLAGNQKKSGLNHYIRRKKFRKDRINISDGFLKKKLPDFSAPS